MYHGICKDDSMKRLRLPHLATAAAAMVTFIIGLVLPMRATAQISTVTTGTPAPWRIPSDDMIEQLLAERMQHNGVGMVVGVIEPAGIRVVAHGRSGATNRRRLDGDTVFQIGSLTKVFTSLLLADMVQRGEVMLDDPAQKYLPDVKMPQRGRPMTLHDLSVHRSGLPSMPTNLRLDADPNPVEAYSVHDLNDFLSSFTPATAPGEKYEYSNLGASLLGRLLAERAGEPYEKLLRERVLQPLGLTSTAINVDRSMAARLAPGHDRYLQPVYTWEMKTLQASGSLRSTANDLARLVAAYLDRRNTTLHDALQLQLATRYPADARQALAWGAQKIDGREVYMHDGGKQGYRSAIAFDTQSGTGIVVLANARTDDRPAALALHLLTGRALPPAPAAPLPKHLEKLGRKALDGFAGHYRLGPEEELIVIRKRDHLLIDYTGEGYGMEFLASGRHDFFYNVGNDEITFQVDDAGRVTELWLYEDGKPAGKYRVAVREP
jgi:CubicO group peptidase (beta-lactamase class C family)